MNARRLGWIAAFALAGSSGAVRDAEAGGPACAVGQRGAFELSSGASLRSLERIASASGPGWRMTVDSARGTGGIVRLDRARAAAAEYLGEGIYAGCDQATLEAVYSALVAAVPEDAFELPLLG